jgi:hypothetical protein
MSPNELAFIRELGKRLYEVLETPKPSWAQLGDTTRSVWIERAEKLYADSGQQDTFIQDEES